jgi:hypothetical protein
MILLEVVRHLGPLAVVHICYAFFPFKTVSRLRRRDRQTASNAVELQLFDKQSRPERENKIDEKAIGAFQ